MDGKKKTHLDNLGRMARKKFSGQQKFFIRSVVGEYVFVCVCVFALNLCVCVFVRKTSFARWSLMFNGSQGRMYMKLASLYFISIECAQNI